MFLEGLLGAIQGGANYIGDNAKQKNEFQQKVDLRNIDAENKMDQLKKMAEMGLIKQAIVESMNPKSRGVTFGDEMVEPIISEAVLDTISNIKPQPSPQPKKSGFRLPGPNPFSLMGGQQAPSRFGPSESKPAPSGGLQVDQQKLQAELKRRGL